MTDTSNLVEPYRQNGFHREGKPGGKNAIKDCVLRKVSEKTGLDEDDLKDSLESGTLNQVLNNLGFSQVDVAALRKEAIKEVLQSGQSASERFLSADSQAQDRAHSSTKATTSQSDSMAQSMESVLSEFSEKLGITTEELLSYLMEQRISPWDFAKENGLKWGLVKTGSLFDRAA